MNALPVPPGQTPRRWQVEALGALRSALPMYQSCLISAATGTGKGTLIAGIAQLCHGAGLRPLILAHREELVTEIPDRIRKIVGHASTGIVMAVADYWKLIRETLGTDGSGGWAVSPEGPAGSTVTVTSSTGIASAARAFSSILNSPSSNA